MTSLPGQGNERQDSIVSRFHSFSAWLQNHRAMLLLAMGLLDAFLLGDVFERIGYAPQLLLGGTFGLGSVLILAEVILICLLPGSAIGLVLGKRWAMVLYFFQVPLRAIFLCLTFGFIGYLAAWSAMPAWHRPLVLLAVFLELVRLGVTIILFRMRTPAS